jgi:hypothetical protein
MIPASGASNTAAVGRLRRHRRSHRGERRSPFRICRRRVIGAVGWSMVTYVRPFQAGPTGMPSGRRAWRLRRSRDVYGLVVEHFRSEVSPVGPGDRAELRIDTDFGEEPLISEGLEDGPN